MKGILKADPGARFRFWGGDKMAAIGGAENLAMHYEKASFMGFTEVLKNLRTIFGQIEQCKRDVAAYAPDVLVLIDYAGFNLRLARFGRERGIPTYYYIAPKVWAWKESRVKKIRRWVDRLFVIFPFEVEYFRRRGIEAIYEGNPLMDAIDARRAALGSKEEFRAVHGLDGRPLVACLAGSRRSEIGYNLPFMVELSGQFPQYQFVVAGVPWLDRSVYEPLIAGSPRALRLRRDLRVAGPQRGGRRHVGDCDARDGSARHARDGMLSPRLAVDADRQDVSQDEIRLARQPRTRPRVRARAAATPYDDGQCDGPSCRPFCPEGPSTSG